MSHELTIRANGNAEMAYVGETPWHGLGNELQAGATIEEWQAAAGMDWKILRSKIRYAVDRTGDESTYMEFPEKHVLFRSDSKAGLGVVSEQFEIVQPKAVVEFFRDLTEAAGFTLETAGTLFGGRRFWALATIGESAYVADPRDGMKRHLMLSTSCDGTMATEGRYMDTRAVCWNTIQAGMREAKAKFRITHRTKFNAAEAKRELGVDEAHQSFAAAMENFKRLADTRIDDVRAVQQTIALLHPDNADMDAKALRKVADSKPVQRIMQLTTGRARGSDFDGARGTQWGWMNAVTEYVDHEARARSNENRLNSAWFGKGSEIKEQAFEMALAGSSGTVTRYQAAETESVPAGLLDHILSQV